MKKQYLVRVPWNCTFICRVEAENEEDAKDRAIACGWPALCHSCSNEVEIDEANDNADIVVEEV